MTAERDLILALFRRLYAEGAIDSDDIVAIAKDLSGRGGEDHAHLAYLTKLTIIESEIAMSPPSESLEVQHRRKQMRLRTAAIEEGRE